MATEDCGCVYMPEGEACEFASKSTPTARQAHACCECGDEIPVGAKYERVSMKFEGEMSAVKTCLPCVEIRNLLCCDGYMFEYLWQAIRDYFGEGGKITGCFEKLESAVAKDKLANAYRDFLSLHRA